MQSSNDPEAKKWVREGKNIYTASKTGRALLSVSMLVAASALPAAGAINKKMLRLRAGSHGLLHGFHASKGPVLQCLGDSLYDKRTTVAGGGTEGPVKKLVEENEGSVITTRRVELREAAKKALISRKRFQQAQMGEADKGGVGNPRKITWWYDPLTCSSMYAGDMVKWETAEACLADDQTGSKLLWDCHNQSLTGDDLHFCFFYNHNYIIYNFAMEGTCAGGRRRWRGYIST
ncbi:hypothetical protein OIU85_021323 [Salix viminalis]|uniref:Uncharacterized protein n=1 Tax=Salix viminalis TaxID=40686 RepID=A0A9Q0ZDN2_SALVM|nr:hypothetical protein OIU85_021323 [Salix viminalis]